MLLKTVMIRFVEPGAMCTEDILSIKVEDREAQKDCDLMIGNATKDFFKKEKDKSLDETPTGALPLDPTRGA